MKTIACAVAALLFALSAWAAAAEVGPTDPPGWYLEGPGARLGPFGSQGLCLDLRNRQPGAERYHCVEYGTQYWLVVGQTAVTPGPFATLPACAQARARAAASGRNFTCTRRSPSSRPLPGTAGVPSAVPGAATRM